MITNTTPTILILDDDHVMLGLWADMVALLGCESTKSRHGDDAFALIRAGNYCAVLCDIFHEGLNGYELVKKVRQVNPVIPMIACSGAGNEETALAAGFDVFLKKPCKVEELLRAIVHSVRSKENVTLAESMTKSCIDRGWNLSETS